MRVREQSHRRLVSLWGETTALRVRYRCRACGGSLSVWRDESLDESGCLPEVLARLHQLATELPYRKTSKILSTWGVTLSKSQVCKLNGRLNSSSQTQAAAALRALTEQPLASRVQLHKTWVIESDGCFVPIWLPETKTLVYQEVKVAVLYPLNSPMERYYLSFLGDKERFNEQVHGLLRHAGVTQEDSLIGVSDGASWIANLFSDLGVRQHILDVFHASCALEKVMQALGWAEEAREEARGQLLLGKLDVATWLETHVPLNAKLNEEGQEKLSYLQRQAALGHTRYPQFKEEGLVVIGSGQVEGANKALISNRMKLSGMRWPQEGARGMAFVRGESNSHRHLIDFHEVRQQAFPHPMAA